MVSIFKNRFGVPGVIAVAALVLAMAGGAYAAKKYVITSTSQIKPSVLKALQGKAGAPGSPGAQGGAGTAGSNGTNGTNGAPGAPGKSVTVTEIEAGEAECEERGGAMVKQEGAGSGTEVCNGEDGSPWTAGGTLPKGATLAGDWSLSGRTSGGGTIADQVIDTVSFGIPLAAAPVPHYIPAPTPTEESNEEFPTPPAGCTGSVESPGADQGNLCVFARRETNTESEIGPFKFPNICAISSVGNCALTIGAEADPFGFGLVTVAHEAGFVALLGTWAVTGS